MKRVFSYLLILIGVVCLTGCGTTNDSKKYNIDVKSDENINVSTYVSYDESYLIINLTNNNSYDIGSFDVVATYYDIEGNKVDEEDIMELDFKSGSDFVTVLDLPQDDDYNYYVPEKIELEVKVDKEYQEMVELEPMYNDKIKTSYEVEGENILLTVENQSDIDLDDVVVAVLFMKDKKAIAAEALGGPLDKGESITEEVEIPIDWEKSEDEDVLIDYDDIKIVVNNAVTW